MKGEKSGRGQGKGEGGWGGVKREEWVQLSLCWWVIGTADHIVAGRQETENLTGRSQKQGVKHLPPLN